MLRILYARRREYEQAVQAHAADLFRFAYWLCRDRALAAGLVQEAYLRAWCAWDGLREPRVARGWLFTFVRTEHARDAAPIDPGADAPVAESARDARDALAALPEPLREALLLQVLGGFSCAEIGWLLGTTEDEAMARLMRARQALRPVRAPPTLALAAGLAL
jgi:RNA polymerase sigma-70 factor (ECF subfamily)